MIGRKVYYDVIDGEVILLTGLYGDGFKARSLEQDISTYKVLSERNVESFDVLELSYGQFENNLSESISYRVNPDTKELEFSYPDPNEPEGEQPYQAPLSEQINQLKVNSARSNAELFEMIIMMSGGMM